MDISDTLAPNSDQLDAIELVSGPRTFQVESVSRGNAEQPVQIHLAGFPRPWRPGKSMRRVLVAAWGADASAYVGRSVTLFCDQSVMFGKEKVGGTRIAALSHIDKPLSVPLLVSRGRSAMYKVDPLKDEPRPPTPTEPSADQVAASESIDELRGWWQHSSPERKAQIESRVSDLQAAQNSEADA